MLDNLSKKLNEYVNAHKLLDKDLHGQDERNSQRYSAGVRLEKLGELKKIHYDSCKLLHDDYKKEILNTFEEAFKQMNAATMIPLDQGMLNNLHMFEQMDSISKEEANSLYETTKNNYLANKKVSNFLVKIGEGDEMLKKYINYLQTKDAKEMFFIPLDSIMSLVEELKNYIMNSIFADSNNDFSNMNYQIENILRGEYINEVKHQGDIFIARYQQ